MKRYETAYLKTQVEKEGNRFISEEIIDGDHKIYYVCKNGHETYSWWRSWIAGHRCKYCASEANIKYTNKYITDILESEGYEISSIIKTGKLNNSRRIYYKCPNGHEHYLSLSSFVQGKRCKFCLYESKRYTYKFIKEQFEKEDYVLLTKTYKNSYQKLRFICPNKHEHSITWNNWQSGSRCAICAGVQKKTLEFVREQLKSEGGILVTKEYKNSTQKLKYVCANGHESTTTWANWSRGFRCRKCFDEKNSIHQKNLWATPEYQKKMAKAFAIKPNKPETLLNNLLQDMFPEEYKYVGDFQFWLGGKNPDFMNINGQKKLIELFGDYWHKNDNPEDRINHFNQYGFNTLVIWEHELKNLDKLCNTLTEFHSN